MFSEWPLSFLHFVFYHLRDTKNTNGPSFDFRGAEMGPGAHSRIREAMSGRQVLSVSVESATECQIMT